MATTSADQLAAINRVIQYLEIGSAGRASIDEITAATLANIFGQSCGFRCGCPGTLTEGLRDNPVATLLRLVTCPSVIPIAAAAAGVAVELLPGALAQFGILGAATVTNTGATVINGDLGLYAGSAVTGFPPGAVSGVMHITDPAAAAAQLALVAQYNYYAGLPSTATVAGDLAGQTLYPGIYKSTSSLSVGPGPGNLTLDAQGDPNALWVFQVASTFDVANGKSILLTNGAKADRVIWQVGSSSTLGTTSLVKGTIMALTSVTLDTGAILLGRALAQTGVVTLDTNNVIVPAP